MACYHLVSEGLKRTNCAGRRKRTLYFLLACLSGDLHRQSPWFSVFRLGLCCERCFCLWGFSAPIISHMSQLHIVIFSLSLPLSLPLSFTLLSPSLLYCILEPWLFIDSGSAAFAVSQDTSCSPPCCHVNVPPHAICTGCFCAST